MHISKRNAVNKAAVAEEFSGVGSGETSFSFELFSVPQVSVVFEHCSSFVYNNFNDYSTIYSYFC